MEKNKKIFQMRGSFQLATKLRVNEIKYSFVEMLKIGFQKEKQ